MKLTQPEYGEKIRVLRVLKRLTQYKFAEKVGCHVSWLSLIENGMEKGNDTLRENICNFFDVDIDTLEPR